jgi:hypothetical protein
MKGGIVKNRRMTFGNAAFHDAGELHDRYEGEAVWIVGSDPSLSGYPDSFLDGKVGITLHLAHVKFPQATFRYSSELDRSKYLLPLYKEYRSLPLIAAMPMYGVSMEATLDLLGDNAEVYFHRMVSYLPTGVRGEVSQEFTRFKVAQTRRGEAGVWGGHGSCLHTCVYMAVLMGASEINLIGCGHGMYGGGTEHFAAVEGAHNAIRPGYKSFDDPTDSVPCIEQTRALQGACLAEGIGFNWYRAYSPAMDDRLAIDEAWFADMQARAKAMRKVKLSRKLGRALIKRPYTRIIARR